MSGVCFCNLRILVPASALSRRVNCPPLALRTIPLRCFSTRPVRRYPRRATPFRAFREPTNDGSHSYASPGSSKEAWYLNDGPTTFSTSSSSPESSTEAPSPPSTLPSFLHPLWLHLLSSPFLDPASISFVDARTAQAELDVREMDASVSSWVDWVVIASLRSGRERGIRGACDGVKSAVRRLCCFASAKLINRKYLDARHFARTGQ